MTSIGGTLRQERLKRGLELEQISKELKISSRFLEAIEEEHFDKLPGGVFAKSFVRQYAHHLGLDGDEYAVAIQQAVEPFASNALLDALPAMQPVEIAVPRVEEWQSVARHFNWSASLPALALVVFTMIVCSGIYAWWQRGRRPVQAQEQKTKITQTAKTSPAVGKPQPQAASPAPGQPSSSADVTTSAQSASAAGAPAATQAGEPASSNSANRPAQPQTGEPAANPGSTSPPDAAVPGAGVKVEVSATEPVWLLAKADGKVIFSGTVDTNQTRTLEAKDAVTLRVGNAGGVSITLNGKPIGPLGSKGQVRTLQLTSGGFHIEAVPKPSLPPERL